MCPPHSHSSKRNFFIVFQIDFITLGVSKYIFQVYGSVYGSMDIILMFYYELVLTFIGPIKAQVALVITPILPPLPDVSTTLVPLASFIKYCLSSFVLYIPE